MAICIMVQVGETSTPIKELLSENLKQADNLRMGQLANGFSYVMLPNKVPPQRFEAHLEMHAGEAGFCFAADMPESIISLMLRQ